MPDSHLVLYYRALLREKKTAKKPRKPRRHYTRAEERVRIHRKEVYDRTHKKRRVSKKVLEARAKRKERTAARRQSKVNLRARMASILRQERG